MELHQCTAKVRSKVLATAPAFKMLESAQAKVRVKRRACISIRNPPKKAAPSNAKAVGKGKPKANGIGKGKGQSPKKPTPELLPKTISANKKFIRNHAIDDLIFDDAIQNTQSLRKLVTHR